ncbi:MAG TPA: hypothetical protein VHB98_13055 [Chloroflexota bacterium]|nr:hypothetical protein [Chloroflexota bacterium]
MWLEYVDENRSDDAREWDTGSADRQLAQLLANVSGLPVWVKGGAAYTLYPLETTDPLAADARKAAGMAPDQPDEGVRPAIAPSLPA